MTTHETLEAKVDQLFAKWNQSDSPGAALAVTRDGEIVYKQGYGTANLEYDVPITTRTIFDIASVSKQFAGFAIATLSHEGKLSLDDDIRMYLPDVPGFWKHNHNSAPLASHQWTAGLGAIPCHRR